MTIFDNPVFEDSKVESESKKKSEQAVVSVTIFGFKVNHVKKFLPK